MLEIIIVIIAFSLLIIFHELGHFLLAKKFNVKVEEFGLGLPPRVFGKKIGETIFSLNAIPFGGFVRMYGEEKDIKDPRSFTGKPIWQRALIVAAGCIAFWIVAAVLFSIILGMGAPIAISDDEKIDDARVQITAIAPESPAKKAGLEMGDTIRELRITNYELQIDKVREVQEFTALHRGREITLTIERGKEVFEKTLISRQDPPEGQGRIGIAMARTTIKSLPWWQAPIEGVRVTANLTYIIIVIFGQIIGNLIQGEPMPPGVEVMGPIRILGFMGDKINLGIVYFLKIIAIIAIHLAIINLLPIPALDGGKLVFLGIEGVRGKPIPQRIEQNITGVFFFLLIALIIFITIKDIVRLF